MTLLFSCILLDTVFFLIFFIKSAADQPFRDLTAQLVDYLVRYSVCMNFSLQVFCQILDNLCLLFFGIFFYPVKFFDGGKEISSSLDGCETVIPKMKPPAVSSWTKVSKKIPPLIAICSNQDSSSICSCLTIDSSITTTIAGGLSPMQMTFFQMGFSFARPFILEAAKCSRTYLISLRWSNLGRCSLRRLVAAFRLQHLYYTNAYTIGR